MSIRAQILFAGVGLAIAVVWQFRAVRSTLAEARVATNRAVIADEIQRGAAELLAIAQTASDVARARVREQWRIRYASLLNQVLRAHEDTSGRLQSIVQDIRDELSELQWVMRRLDVARSRTVAGNSALEQALQSEIGSIAYMIVHRATKMKQIWRSTADAAESRTRHVAFWSSVISICALLVGAAWVHLTLLGPIKKLHGGTSALKRANLDYRIPNLGRNELGGLARAFNDMSAALAERTLELEKAKSAAESRARELEHQKFALDEHAIVAVTDPSGKITYANDKFCEISQFAREELIGQNHRIVSSGHHSRPFFGELWTAITAGKVWHDEVCNRAKDGSLYWVDTTIVPFKDEVGRITHFVAIRTDITEHKRAEAALRASLAAAELANSANASKSEFLANMSHEIRTPMTAILGFADVILEHGNLNNAPPERTEAARTIKRNGQYLLGIINDILDLSKIEAGKMTMERVACSPCKIIADVSALMCVRADAKGLPFHFEYIGAVPKTIHTDPMRLRQVLINLIGNAIKFTETGAVRLVTRFVDDGDEPYLQFDVIDTGRGMTQEQVAGLFQPFMQADTSTTRRFGGTGLGLTISRRFAELLGGDIIVAATEIDVGSTFRVTVATGSLEGVRMLEDPMSASLVEDSDASCSTTGPSDLHGCRVLLAEDGPDNQRLIAHVLKKARAEVTVKENGRLAVDAALAAQDEGSPFDVILMDMQMPVMDGYEATGHLRRMGYTGTIIALTAHAMGGDREKCIRAGCDDYATKPIDRAKLTQMIHARYQVVGA